MEGYINLMLALRLTLLYQTAVLNMVDHPLFNQTRQHFVHISIVHVSIVHVSIVHISKPISTVYAVVDVQ